METDEEPSVEATQAGIAAATPGPQALDHQAFGDPCVEAEGQVEARDTVNDVEVKAQYVRTEFEFSSWVAGGISS